MNIFLNKDYYLRISDFDKYGRIFPSSVLDIFQDIAASHANEIGIGFNSMKEHNSLWVLTKVKYEIQKSPSPHETVHVKTWPLAPEKIRFIREYHITDSKGETLIKGSSEWVVINFETRKIMSAVDVFPIKDGFLSDKMFSEPLKKIADIELCENPYSVKTAFTDCDINGHVNNIKYASFILDALELPADKNIKTFQLDYIKEVLSNTELNLYCKYGENDIFVKGLGSDEKKRFTCHITL